VANVGGVTCLIQSGRRYPAMAIITVAAGWRGYRLAGGGVYCRLIRK